MIPNTPARIVFNIIERIDGKAVAWYASIRGGLILYIRKGKHTGYYHACIGTMEVGKFDAAHRAMMFLEKRVNEG